MDTFTTSFSSSSSLQIVQKPIAPFRQPLLIVVNDDEESIADEEENKDITIVNSQSSSGKVIGCVSIDEIKKKDKARKGTRIEKRKKRKEKSEQNKELGEAKNSSKITDSDIKMVNELTSKLEDLMGNTSFTNESAATPPSSSTPTKLPPLARPKSAGAALQTSHIEIDEQMSREVVRMILQNASKARPSTASVASNNSMAVSDTSHSYHESATKLSNWRHHTFVSPKHEILAQLHAAHRSKKQLSQRITSNGVGHDANDLSKQLVPPKFRHLQHFQVDDSGRDYIALVIVEIMRCNNLRNSFNKAQAKGIADPYVEVSMGFQIETTEIIDNDLSPEFNETIMMCWDGHTDLRLKVKDSDDHYEEELLGQFRVKLSQLELDTRHNFKNERLNDAEGRIERHGSITFSIVIKGTTHPNKIPSRPSSRVTSFAKESFDEYKDEEFEV